MEDLGRLGRVWPEADVENSDVETVIDDLLDAQYGSPLCFIAFNAAERWSRDVSEDIARDCFGAAIWRAVNYQRASRILSNAMQATPAN
jgi:hypothetical protein